MRRLGRVLVGAGLFLSAAVEIGVGGRLAHATTDHEDRYDYATGRLTQRFFAALREWDLDTAEAEWSRMVAASPADDVWPIYCEGVLRFHQARYEQSAARFRQLRQESALEPQLAGQVAFYEEALAITPRFVRKETEHFIFHYTAEDEVLIHYLPELMERIRTVLGKDFGYSPPEKVVVEVMPSFQVFIDASPLTREEIETSGTIALCKYNRLMFTSPRVLHRGYDWRETVAHEYVHYLISRITRNRVPIWLHEGTAKYEQGRPFGDDKGRTPETINVLAKAIEEDYLITFAQMSPSMAKLKSRNDVRLAFAEVSHIFEWMIETRGYEGMRKLFELLAGEMEMEPALKAVYGVGFEQVEKKLIPYIRSKGYRYDPRLEEIPLSFRESNESLEDGAAGEEMLETRTLGETKSRDFSWLGDALRDRNYIEAAAIEYRKGVAASETLSPVLHNKLALVEMMRKEYKAAETTLLAVRPYYTDYTPTFKRLGLIYVELGEWKKARENLEIAVGLNPFDPAVHLALAAAYGHLNDTVGRDREKAILEILAPAPAEPHLPPSAPPDSPAPVEP